MGKRRREENDYSRRLAVQRRTRSAGPSPLGAKLLAGLGRWLITIWVGVLVLGIALGAWLLGIVTPIDSDFPTSVGFGAMIGLFSGLITAAGMTGGVLMVGWWGVLPGAGVGASMFGYVAALSTEGPWWAVTIIGFELAIVGFFIAGARSGYLPPTVVTRFGSPLVAVGGLVALWVGVDQGNLKLVLIGSGVVLVPLVLGGYVLFERARARREGEPSGGRPDEKGVTRAG